MNDKIYLLLFNGIRVQIKIQKSKWKISVQYWNQNKIKICDESTLFFGIYLWVVPRSYFASNWIIYLFICKKMDTPGMSIHVWYVSKRGMVAYLKYLCFL